MRKDTMSKMRMAKNHSQNLEKIKISPLAKEMWLVFSTKKIHVIILATTKRPPLLTNMFAFTALLRATLPGIGKESVLKNLSQKTKWALSFDSAKK